MKTLVIMRHGKSSWKDSSLPDNERPLKKRGRKDSARVGALLKKKDLEPDIVLCSSAVRARQTAEIVVDEMEYEGPVEYMDELYMAEPEVIFARLRALPDVERAMVIGHNPGLETLYQILTGEISSLPTAAVAVLRLQLEEWAQLNLETRVSVEHLWRPRELD